MRERLSKKLFGADRGAGTKPVPAACGAEPPAEPLAGCGYRHRPGSRIPGSAAEDSPPLSWRKVFGGVNAFKFVLSSQLPPPAPGNSFGEMKKQA